MTKRNIGIRQGDSPENYRDYQREYQKLYFHEHQDEWNDYLLRRRYRLKTVDELKTMLSNKLSTSCTMKSHKRERLIKILKEIISEKEHIDYEPYDGIIDIRDELEKLTRDANNKGL